MMKRLRLMPHNLQLLSEDRFGCREAYALEHQLFTYLRGMKGRIGRFGVKNNNVRSPVDQYERSKNQLKM